MKRAEDQPTSQSKRIHQSSTELASGGSPYNVSSSSPSSSSRETASAMEKNKQLHQEPGGVPAPGSAANSSGLEQQHQHQQQQQPQQQQPVYVDSEDLFTIAPDVGLTKLCDAMCIPPPGDPEHASTETDGEEGSTTWEPHLWSY